MIPAYYINLSRAPERKTHLESLAVEAKIDIERIEAIDGKLLSDQEFERVHPQGTGRRMTKGEVACFLSHRKAWQRIANSQNSHGLVLEDDVYFSHSLGRLLEHDGWITPTMEVVKLDKGTDKKVCLSRNFIVAEGIEFRRLQSIHLRAGAYIISRGFAMKLICETQTFDVPVDDFMFGPGCGIFETTEIWQANPTVCIHPQHTKANFLPKESTVSFLDKERQLNRREFSRNRSALSVFWRELKRPVRDLYHFLQRTFVNTRSDKVWVKLDFKE